ENWGYEPEYLNTFARHYQTGETIPAEYISRIVDSKNYLSACLQVRQLHFGYLDLAWHDRTSPVHEDIHTLEMNALSKYETLPFVEGTCISTAFSHIFSGGYAAGYYSYKWAEVLEADAFSAFEEKGIFSREVADSFIENVLTKGSTEDEAVLYRRFRGHDPQPEALLRKLGISSNK
ncbi:MAG TPA: peptidase M3, partial [Rikenellaceae bacterium]|nr:peptidase M3 [Rikenellaceae bacterium]